MAKKKMKLKSVSELTPDERVQVLLKRWLKVKCHSIEQKKKIERIANCVFNSIDEYEESMAPIYEAKEWNRRIDQKIIQKNNLTSKIKMEIGNLLPPYNWFVYKVGLIDCAVGVSTTDWGGYTRIVHIEENSNILRKLGHD